MIFAGPPERGRRARGRTRRPGDRERLPQKGSRLRRWRPRNVILDVVKAVNIRIGWSKRRRGASGTVEAGDAPEDDVEDDESYARRPPVEPFGARSDDVDYVPLVGERTTDCGRDRGVVFDDQEMQRRTCREGLPQPGRGSPTTTAEMVGRQAVGRRAAESAGGRVAGRAVRSAGRSSSAFAPRARSSRTVGAFAERVGGTLRAVEPRASWCALIYLVEVPIAVAPAESEWQSGSLRSNAGVSPPSAAVVEWSLDRHSDVPWRMSVTPAG